MATMTSLACRFGLMLALTTVATGHTRADQVVMQNGDRYNGKVLSFSATNVVLQSDVLGVVNLSRGQVTSVAVGPVPATNAAPVIALAKTNSSTDLSAAIRQLGTRSNLVNQVRAQFLATTSPEVNQKFDQMLNDLGTGKMSMGDLRAQAKSAAAQLRELEKEAGDDASGSVGLYLTILDSFLAETESASVGISTNAATRKKP
jgi:hypothetical protein